MYLMFKPGQNSSTQYIKCENFIKDEERSIFMFKNVRKIVSKVKVTNNSWTLQESRIFTKPINRAVDVGCNKPTLKTLTESEWEEVIRIHKKILEIQKNLEEL